MPSMSSVPELDLPPEVTASAMPAESVPDGQDITALSTLWASSKVLADLQQRFGRARKLEANPATVERVKLFYKTVLRDRTLPAGHRTYAGCRLSRVLLKQQDYKQAGFIAGKLLEHDLPPEMKAHLQETFTRSRAGLEGGA